MTRVIIESPFAGDVARNTEYLKKAVLDSLGRGESPLASHGFYTHFLDDNDPAERKAGIDAGLDWAKAAELVAYYIDLGMSSGMRYALERHTQAARKIEIRQLSVKPFLVFDYTNWRGERSRRKAVFKSFHWGRTEYHPADGVLMRAHCLERGEIRDFAVKDIVFPPTLPE